MFRLDRDDETICAVVTPPGRGGIAVIRLSGIAPYQALKKFCSFLPDKPESHKVFYGYFKTENESIDEVLVTYFKKGRSFTGEETVEISCHGSPIITSKILRALHDSHIRLAQPGEFTYRAFSSGRIDLIQAEAVLELIESQSEKSSKLALSQLRGESSKTLNKIESELTWILAHCEANIDFASEDIEVASQKELLDRLDQVLLKVIDLLSTYKIGKAVFEGVQVALIGEPNVGKSSLLNSIIGYEKAIVSQQPGTTRDVVEVQIIHEGFPIHISDTAGMRESSNEIERIGIEKSYQTIKSSNVCIWVMDSFESPESQRDDFKILFSQAEVVIPVLNKIDLKTPSSIEIKALESQLSQFFELPSDGILQVSAETGEGIRELLDAVLKKALDGQVVENSSVLSNSRHYEGLLKAQTQISKAFELMKNEESPEFVAFELQSALVSVFEVVGKRFDDEVMDRVFSEFCLGK